LNDPEERTAADDNFSFGREETMKIPLILSAVMLSVIASIALSGCSSKPIYELQLAGDAMENARKAEAPEYDPLDWDRARMKWEQANTLINMGHYSEAKDVLLKSVANYHAAEAEATRRVESLVREIKALQTNDESDLRKLEQDSRGSKVRPSVKRRIEAALPGIDEKISVMNADFDAKEYLRSRMAGQEAARYISDLRARFNL
jgi:hypothetical protein